MYGNHGLVLEIDLTTGSISRRDIPESLYRKYLGGSGLGARLLYDELDPDIDPLSPESPLFFLTGLLTATTVPSGCKINVCARSPLTGIWGESVAGGHWPAAFRSTGCDGIVFRGRSAGPVFLKMDGSDAELVPCEDLWGKDTFEAHDILSERCPGCRIASIGPAGERGVRFASIMFDGRIARAVGRCGLGTVMGSKLLKAIVVKGSEKVTLADPDGLREDLKVDVPSIRENTKALTDWSTAGGVEAVEFWGDLAIRNWKLGSFTEGAKKTAAQYYFPKVLVRHRTCHACPIRCAKDVRVTVGPYAGEVGHGPEYETLCGFGANCLNDDYETIIAANDLCNRMGMDTISTAGTVAFALEAYENGLIRPEDTGGVPLEWGSREAILESVNLIAERKGIGKILSLGVRVASEELGGGSSRYAVHTKGLEYPFHDPRAFVSMAANYATANRGACHLEALTYFVGRGVILPDYGLQEPPDPHVKEGKAELAYMMMNYQSLFNSLGLCKFLFLAKVGPSTLARWVERVTGWDTTLESLIQAGERLVNLKRMYNVRLGISAKDDHLPSRLQEDAKPDGKAAGVLPDTKNMVAELYRLRGWSEEGIPTAEKLAELGLEELV